MLWTLLLLVPAALAVIVLLTRFGVRAATFADFFYAKRSVSVFEGALAAAACWIWVIALMVGPQKAYESGAAALAWFVVPNTLAMFLSAALVAILISRWGGRWEAFTEFIGYRFGGEMLGVYTLGITVMMAYAVLVSMVGALDLFSHVFHTSNDAVVIVVAALMLVLALPKGIESSFAADMVKGFTIFLVLCVVVVIVGTEGVHAVVSGSRGVGGDGPGLLSPELIWSFGFSSALSLFSSISVDVQLWQRWLSLRPAVQRITPWLAAPIFGVFVTSIGLLGLVAAGKQLAVAKPSLAGFAAIADAFPSAGVLFMLMVAAVLLATGASALNGVARTWSVDILRLVRKDTSETESIWVARGVMVLVVLVGVVLAKQGVTLLAMFLLVGTYRGALLLPTLLALTTSGARASRLFTIGTLVAMFAGPTVALVRHSALEGGLTVLTLSALLCIFEWVRSARQQKLARL